METQNKNDCKQSEVSNQETEQQKNKFLVRWNDKLGRWDKIILNPILGKPKSDNEEYFLIGMCCSEEAEFEEAEN